MVPLYELKKSCICKEHQNKSYREILDLPPSVFIGLDDQEDVDSIFKRFQIETIRDLGNWKFYHIAKSILYLAGTEEPGKRSKEAISNMNQALMKEWETKPMKDMVEAPISILQGLTDSQSRTLSSIHSAGYPINVKQLANWKYCRYAESLIALSDFEFKRKPIQVVTNSITTISTSITENNENITETLSVSETKVNISPNDDQMNDEPADQIFSSRSVEIVNESLPAPEQIQSSISKTPRRRSSKRRRSSSAMDIDSTPTNYPKVPRNSTPKSAVKRVSRFFDALENDVEISVERRRALGRNLHQLVILNEIEAIEVLLLQGADPDGGGSVRPPLYTAVDLNNIPACEILMKYGASMVFPVVSDGEQTNPLKLALQKPEVIQIFVDRLKELERKANVMN